MTLIDELTDFLENTEHCEYVNKNAVTIEAEDDVTFSANSSLLINKTEGGYEDSAAVELFHKKKKFSRLLNIQSTGDFDKITQAQLLDLYHEGEAEIVCFVNLIYNCCMVFKKQGLKIIASNERNIRHKVMIQLDSPCEFINYTKQYYRLQDHLAGQLELSTKQE